MICEEQNVALIKLCQTFFRTLIPKFTFYLTWRRALERFDCNPFKMGKPNICLQAFLSLHQGVMSSLGLLEAKNEETHFDFL